MPEGGRIVRWILLLLVIAVVAVVLYQLLRPLP
jgi:hypothetical protein